MKRLSVAMTAHVDAGKTTLSEALLYRSGEIRRLGRVDSGNSFLDDREIERRRGITVFSKQAVMKLPDGEYTLIDTPGHADFSAETERALRAADYAVLVISGTDGVQSHTETVWRLLKIYGIPVFVFVNKTDISGQSRDFLLRSLRARLSDRITDFTPCADKSGFYDSLSALTEDMMNAFLENETIPRELIAQAVRERQVFPCYFGSALKLSGIDELICGLEDYTVMPDYGSEFGARVYKITTENGTRLTHMKITGGSLRVRAPLYGDEKVSGIRVYSGSKYTSPEEVFPGTLCAVTGITKSFAGEGLGFEKTLSAPLMESVLSYRVILPEGTDTRKMLEIFKILEDEDPQLKTRYKEQQGEISVCLMGEIQLEILSCVIKERFGITPGFDKGSIAYRETIAAPVIGIGHYEPLRHYAEVHLLIEPAPAGSGITFSSVCSEDVLDRNWQRLILSNLKEKTHSGVLTGSPLTDVKITLLTGRAHLKHTEGGDFRQAALRAVRMGLRCAESVLLEPYYDFTLEIPAENVGRSLCDLERMGAQFLSPEISGETAVIKGSSPVSEMAYYHTEVSGYTKGKGRLSCVLSGYRPCRCAEDIIKEKGYDPDSDLDNSADSVFCSHGAGFIVKWDEVKAYAHLDSGYSFEKKDSSAKETPPVRPASSPADDKELMAIFERTYGKINRDPRRAMRREYEENTERQKAKPLPRGPVYLLVDGYNIIFAWEELKKQARENLDLARSTLINILCNYRGYKKWEVILVFDAYKVGGNTRETENINGISVVYTKEAETADMYIEKTSHELARDRRVYVATSDGAEQLIILGSGACRITASELYEDIKAAGRDIERIISSVSKGSNRGAIRIKGKETSAGSENGGTQDKKGK